VAGEEPVEVELVEFDGAMREPAPREDLEPVGHASSFCASVGFDQANDDVSPLLLEAATLLEHREGLADPGSSAEVDMQEALGSGSGRRSTR
jgi:hypothetical protein